MYYAMTTEKTSSGNTIVSFKDIPECNTQISGDITTLENRLLIEDAILTALSFYQERKERLPIPTDFSTGILFLLSTKSSERIASYKIICDLRTRYPNITEEEIAEMYGFSVEWAHGICDLSKEMDDAYSTRLFDNVKWFGINAPEVSTGFFASSDRWNYFMDDTPKLIFY